MSLFDWFRKKDSASPAEISAGGSKYIRHADKKQSMPGLTEFSTLPYIEKREAAYQQMFGKYALVYDDEFPGLVPHIDVYVYEPSVGRDFYTLVTGGMSDLPMNVPGDVPKAPRRTEIVFYLPADQEPKREYV
jgi:Suppressor of fused protein (SUFU)